MTIRTRHLRMSRLLAATSLTLSAALPAHAQDGGDPPWRVGRLARTTGSVSTHGAGATDWVAAQINIPLTSGDAIWTQPGAGAAIQIADTGVVLAEATELDLATLDDHQLIATEPQGELFLDLRSVQPGDSTSITTPRGVVMLSGAGQYEIAAGDSADPTRISVVTGAAQIVSGSFSLAVHAGQTATVTGTDALRGDVSGLVRDGFLSAQLARPVAPPAGPTDVRYMTGSESLAQYGSWQPAPEYGQVWYPQVGADWAPYREGSWSYVQPWGWTWVDDEPWGFAPFHYGRWAQFGGRWGWVPGEPGAPGGYDRPAYAPALVDFIAAGVVAGAVGGLVAGGFGHGGDVGWIPLGPHDRYTPGFRTSQTYLQRINNYRTINNTTIINNFANRSALTVVPASAMVRSQPIRGIARTGETALAAGSGGQSPYQLVHGAPPVRPAADTRGVTPAAAHGLGLGAMPARPSAPGPAVDPVLFRPHELPASRTPFRGQPVGVAVHAPGPEAAAQMQPARPGLPGLRPPHAAPPNVAPMHPGEPDGPRGPGPQRPAEPAMARPPAPMQQHAVPRQPRFEPRPEPRPEARPGPRPEPAHRAEPPHFQQPHFQPRPEPQRVPPREPAREPAREPPRGPPREPPHAPPPRPAPHPAPPQHHEEHPGHH